ncbi:MAG: hypothetical protein ACI3WR_04220 [Oscillospiraceae bacterium]
MDKQKRKRRDRLQNVLILALSLSALYLFLLSQTGPLELKLPSPSFSSSGAESASPGLSRLQELDWPVTLAVFDAYGDRRCQFLSTGDSAFTAVEGLLEDALCEYPAAEPSSYEAFRQALALPGVYVSFPSAIPFSLFSERLGLPSESDALLRRLLLTAEEGALILYYSDGEQYFRCATALPAAELTATAEGLGGEACLFAFEQEEYAALDPLTVLSSSLPQYAVLTARSREELLESDELLTFFGFSAHTTSRYTEASGTEVVVESPRSLRIAPDGRITYSGSASYAPAGFSLSGQAEPSLPELVDGAYALLSHLLGDGAGEARLYLSSVSYDAGENSCLLSFSYMANGLPLASSDGRAAAELHITGGTVTQLSLLCRSYAVSDSASLLLPLRQAAAIAAGYEGMELALSYVDGGGESASVSWLMR